jgi:hypothetical protein
LLRFFQKPEEVQAGRFCSAAVKGVSRLEIAIGAGSTQDTDTGSHHRETFSEEIESNRFPSVAVFTVSEGIPSGKCSRAFEEWAEMSHSCPF